MIMPVALLFILLVFLLVLLLPGPRRHRPRHHDGHGRRNSNGSHGSLPFQLQCAACAGDRRVCARAAGMARKRRAPSCGASGASDDDVDLFGAASDDVDLSQSDSLPARWGAWRRQYPPRPYVGAPLQTVGGARGLPKDASEQILGGVYTQLAPDADSKSLLVSAEFVLVPLAQKIAEGQQTRPVGIHDELFVYVDPASGEKFQHTTNMHRMWALAQTHPLVDTMYATATSAVVSGVLEEERVLDERGRAIAGEQGEFAMSLSLSVSSLELVLGLTTRNIAESMVALWWCPTGPTWIEMARKGPGSAESARRTAQQVFLDLAELGGGAIPPQEYEASMGLSLSDYNPYVQGAEPPPWHIRAERQANLNIRLTGLRQLIAVLKRKGSPIPSPSEFLTGIPHVNICKAHKGKSFPVPRAFASTKVHFLAALRERFDGMGLCSDCLFCDSFPSLQPASGGYGGVECVSGDHLQARCKVTTVPVFLKRICNKHDGEARLIEEGVPMMIPAGVVRDPAFWSAQFASTAESRKKMLWLSERKKKQDALLSMEDIDWVLREQNNQTLLIRKCEAASGAPWFQIRTGIVVTLAQLYYYGCDLCTAFDIYKLYLDLPIFLHARSRNSEQRGGVSRRYL